ncbi:hypothetical protein ANO11243_014070 [Dothideomycetidae sp. 11243]|nr:hypothetical protein ANO11243_014070 [fungal sp. No.11243]
MNITNECRTVNQALAAANVSNSYTFPGFVPGANGQTVVSNDTADLWTLTTTVTQNGTTFKSELNNFLEVPLSISQHPNSTSEWSPAPVFCELLPSYSFSTISFDASPDGRCTNVASSQCLSDLEQYYVRTASSYITGTPVWSANLESGLFCSTLFNTSPFTVNWPSSCNDFIKTFDKTSWGSDGGATSILNGTCPIGLAGLEPGDNTNKTGDYNVYDHLLNGVTTRIMIRFGNASKEDGGLDVQILCPSPSGPTNKTSPGSRNEKLSSAAGRQHVVGVTGLIVGVMIAASVIF